MKRLIPTCLTALVLTAQPSSAQDSVQTVRDLYAAAAYEDALAAVKRLQGGRPQREVEQYRLFSLTALGRTDEAQSAMEALLRDDPSYALDPAETPPRVQEAFGRVRQRLLPDLAKQMYLEARAALDRKDREEAVGRFEKLMAIIDGAGPEAAALGELRILADGFLGLSRALPAATPAPAVAPVAAASAAPTPRATTAPRTPTETRPVAISQALPAWLPTDSISRRSAFNGRVRVQIGADGRVQAADVVDSVHPVYDQLLLRAARGWSYRPATRDGQPIDAELTVEVNLQPRE